MLLNKQHREYIMHMTCLARPYIHLQLKAWRFQMRTRDARKTKKAKVPKVFDLQKTGLVTYACPHIWEIETQSQFYTQPSMIYNMEVISTRTQILICFVSYVEVTDCEMENNYSVPNHTMLGGGSFVDDEFVAP